MWRFAALAATLSAGSTPSPHRSHWHTEHEGLPWSVRQYLMERSPRRIQQAACTTTDSVNPDSDFKVEYCFNIKGPGKRELSRLKRDELRLNQFERCVNVHGVLLIGKVDANEAAMLESANMIGHLLDTNCDGKVDNPAVVAFLDSFGDKAAPVLTFARTQDAEENVLTSDFAKNVGYHYASYSYVLYEKCLPWKDAVGPLLEEAFHLVHQAGWASAYSELLGVDWSSVACQATKEAQCEWYQHVHNYGCMRLDGVEHCPNKFFDNSTGLDVPDSATAPGTCTVDPDTCSTASCDCVEWFHKVLLAYNEDPASYIYPYSFDAIDLPDWRATLNASHNNRNHGLERKHVAELLGRGPAGARLLAAIEAGCLPLPRSPVSTAPYKCMSAPKSSTAWAPTPCPIPTSSPMLSPTPSPTSKPTSMSTPRPTASLASSPTPAPSQAVNGTMAANGSAKEIDASVALPTRLPHFASLASICLVHFLVRVTGGM